jgi:diguanylate cyclase (GGDEF)-like protein/PAS domain S-box-containing protein
MNPGKSTYPGDATEEVSALVEVLRETEQRIEELTAGEVDSVADRDGRMFLLRRAQTNIETSERRRNQVALAQSKAGLHRAELMAKLAHVITGPDGSFEQWSETLPKLIGVAPGQLPRTTRAWLDILHPDDRSRFRDKAIEASATKLRTELEYRLRKGDGEWIHVRQCMEPLEREGAASVRFQWFNTLQDVTAERKAEEGLRDSESRFRQMAENISDVYFLQNLDSSQMYYVSPAYERIWGRTCESLYANPASWADSIHPDDLDHAFTKLKEGRNTGFDFEYRIVRPDGEMRWIHVRGFPVLDEAGNRYRTAGVASDITQRKQAADELRRSEVLKGAILESSLDCLITIDDEGKIVEFNPAAEAAFGLTREHALGQVMVDLIVPPRLRDAHRRGFAHYLATGKGPVLGKRLELEALRADGTEFPIELAITSVGGTSTPLFTGFIRDITARKEADGKIKRLNRVYAVLSEINSLIVRARDRGELFGEACRIAVQSGQFPLAWVAVADPRDQLVKAVAWAGDEDGFVLLTRPTVGAKGHGKAGLSAQAIEKHIPVICNDIEAAGSAIRYAKEALERGYRSAAAFPLVVEGTAIGALVLCAAEADFFDDEETKLLVELAGNISFALEHVEKEEKVRRLTRVHAVLSGINAAIVRIRGREELFREACRIAVQSGQFRLALVAVADPHDQLVKAVAWAGDERGFVELTRPTVDAKGQGKAGLGAQAIEKHIPAICNDIAADGSAMRYAKEALERGYRSAAALPLMVDGTAIGALVLYAAEAGFFDDEETKLLVELAGNISFALEHIDKEEKIRRLTRVHAVLSGINALIVRAQDREELFREACRIAVEDGEFLVAWIGIVDRSAMRIVPVASAGADTGFFDEIRIRFSLLDDAPAGHGIAAMAVREKHAVVVNDVVADPRIRNKNAHADRGIRSVVSLPLLIADEPVAIFGLHATEAGYFDEAEMKLLRELAGNIAFAIDHIEKQERLDYLAYYDALTGLANRSLFLDRVAQYMRSAVSGGHKLALYLIDLERFKNINDSLGQPAGDALLRQVAEWLTHNVGDANLVARVGADHFAVVVPEIEHEEEVARALEKTMGAFLDHPFLLNGAVFRIAAKVGVAVFPDNGANAETLYKHAEAALKKAKASGDRYLFYTQKMTEAMAGKLTLENQLRQALDKEEFVLHYQPKVSIASGKLTGAEALIRWNDPHTGLVPPGRFIPILEETGLIHDVGRWALRKAIEDYLRWRAAGLAAARIAVNVSPLQLRNRGFISEIEQVIGIDAHAPAGLELEITESLIMEDVQHNIASLEAIRAMGVTIAIDDFGTGFSSLSYLAKLPVDTLKIDRMFVNEMTAAPQGLALVSTIITLAHSLKLKVVAEGVETEEQSRLLRSLNCDEMQGFLFSKPVPREIFESRFLAPAPMALELHQG